MTDEDRCCSTFRFYAYGEAAEIQEEYLGHYTVTEEEHEGAKVYKNGDGKYLYKISNGTWRAGSSRIGRVATGYIRSVDTADCPFAIRQWEYWDSTSGWSSEDKIRTKQWCIPKSVKGFCSAGGYYCMRECEEYPDYCNVKLSSSEWMSIINNLTSTSTTISTTEESTTAEG